jgi:hypothetical protein
MLFDEPLLKKASFSAWQKSRVRIQTNPKHTKHPTPHLVGQITAYPGALGRLSSRETSTDFLSPTPGNPTSP